MNVTPVWATEDASFLRDRRSLYNQEVMFYDLAVVLVDQPDLDQLWLANSPLADAAPRLPDGAGTGVLVFFDGGELDVISVDVINCQITEITFSRVFPSHRRDTMRAILYVPGIVDLSGQFLGP